MHPCSARTAGTIWRQCLRTSSRLPGFTVTTAMTWITCFSSSNKKSTLPDGVALLPQGDGELDFHFARSIVGHRVCPGVEPGQQANAEALDVAARADAGLVLGEALLGRKPGAADVDARLGDVVLGIRAPEAGDVVDRRVELDHVHAVAVSL